MYSRYLSRQSYSPQSEKSPQKGAAPLSQKSAQRQTPFLFSGLQFDSSDLLVLFILLLTMQDEQQNTALLSAVLYFFM